MSVKKMILKFLTDFLLLSLTGSVMLMNLLYHNHDAGFFCNDHSLKYPYKRSTVSIQAVLITSIIFPFFIFGAVLLLDEVASRQQQGSPRLQEWLLHLYNAYYTYYFGISSCSSMMWVPKYLDGNLRPFFFDLCRPVMPDNSTCDDPINHGIYIEDYRCSGVEELPHDVFRTFPSGHATIMSYTMTYIVIYLQVKVKRRFELARYFTQLFCSCAAFYVSISRISDHHHHPEDVVVGMGLGTGMAVLYVKYFAYDKILETETERGQGVERNIERGPMF